MNECFWLLKLAIEFFRQWLNFSSNDYKCLRINGGDRTIVDWNYKIFWSLDLVIDILWLPNLMIKKLGIQKFLIAKLI
jgi:hypothetical protein